jgi:hypothetical protein
MRNEIGPYLYVATPGAEGAPQTATLISVEVLWREGERAVIAIGGRLEAGAAAIIEGNQRLYPGAQVMPVNVGAVKETAQQG